MGRGLASASVPPEVILEAFALRQDGEIIHKTTARSDLVGSKAGFMVGNLPVVRIEHEGRTRRIAASRVGWVLATGEWPRGKVALLNGGGYRPSNLSLVPHGQHVRNGTGGKAQALKVRAETDTALLTALLDHPAASVADLARTVGLSNGPVSARLGRLEKQGLAEGPKCAVGRSWMLTGKGRELAGQALAPLDDLDRDILRLIAVTPLRQVPISRRVGCCIMTARRRLDLLAERGLIEVDVARRYIPTATGIETLGTEAVPVVSSWLRREAISAAMARDVTVRHETHPESSEDVKVKKAGASHRFDTAGLGRPKGRPRGSTAWSETTLTQRRSGAVAAE